MDPPECGSGHNDRDDKAKQASVSMGKHTTGPEDQRAGPMVRFGQLSEHADKPFYFCSNGEWQKAQSSRIGSPPRSEYKAGSGKEAENTEIGQCTTSRSGSNVQSIQPNVAAVQTDGANAYRSGRFTEAATLYQTACSLDPSNAVHWSNLAAAQIALGQYTAAMDAAHKGLACARVSTEVNKKLRMRLGRAAFYAREYKTSVDALSSVEVLHASTKSLLKAAALRLKSASKCITANSPPNPGLRASAINKSAPYDGIGHGSVVPATEIDLVDPSDYVAWDKMRYAMRKEPSTSSVPPPKARVSTRKFPLRDILLDPEGASPIQIFFGGVGDFRNVIGTLSTLWKELSQLQEGEKLTDEQLASVRLEMVVNDTNNTILARGWVLMTLLKSYGALLAEEGDSARTRFLRDVVFDVYMSPILLPYASSAIKGVLRKGIPEKSKQSVWGGCFADEKTRDSMHQEFDRWGTTSVTATDMFNYVVPPGSDTAQGQVTPDAVDFSADGEDQMSIRSRIRDEVSTWTSGEIVDNAIALNLRSEDSSGRATEVEIEDLRDVIIDLLVNVPSTKVEDEHLTYGPGRLNLDEGEYTRAWRDYKQYHVLFDWTQFADYIELVHEHSSPEDTDLRRLFRKHILPRLEPNCTFISENFYESGKFSECPFEVMMELLGQDPNTPAKVCKTPPCKQLSQVLEPFFADAARALQLLSQNGSLTMTFVGGDALVAATRLGKDASEESEVATCLHRVYLSNIPDSTGLLPVFARFLPLLDEEEGLIITSNRHNCNLWQTVSDYVFSTTRLPSLQHLEDVLGVELVGGGINHNVMVWELAPRRSIIESFAPNDFMSWIHDIFLRIVITPVLSAEQLLQPDGENCAMTLDTFCEILCWLVAERGMRAPSHWVGDALTPIFDNLLETSALPPTSSPSSKSDSPLCTTGIGRPKARIDTSNFQAELERCWSSWNTYIDVPIPSASHCTIPGCTIEVSIAFSKESCDELKDRSRAMFSRLAFHQRKLVCAIVLHDSADLLRGVQDTIEQKRATTVADVAQRVSDMHGETQLFCGVDWDIDTGRLRLQLKQSRFIHWRSKYSHGLVILYRPDLPEASLILRPILISLSKACEYRGTFTLSPDSDPERDQSLHICALCGGQAAVQRCSRCKTTYYCNAQCQKIHWARQHKKMCQRAT